MKGVQNSYRSIPFKFTAEMVDRWHSCQTPATGFWLVVIEILSVFTLWGGPQVSCSPIPISENTAWFKKMYSISSSGFFLKLVKIQKTLFSNRTELHPIGTGCSTFSEWISTATMDRSRRERRPGASVLAPEISWSHTLRLFLVGVRKNKAVYVPSLPTTFDDLKNRITTAVNSATQDFLLRVSNEFSYRLDVTRAGRERGTLNIYKLHCKYHQM